MKQFLIPITIAALVASSGALRADDTATIDGATNVRMEQRAASTPYRRAVVNIKGNDNQMEVIGFDTNGILGPMSLWELTAEFPGRAALYYLRVNTAGTGFEFAAGGGGGGGTGDVTGPASSVDDRIVTFDGTTGKIIQDGGSTVANLLARANHTGTQAFSTLTGLPTTLAGYTIADGQPLDSDLSSIAALTTTAFGRGLLDDADASAARTTIGTVIGTDVQAFDSDLASVAALTTTAFGRGVLDDADASALRTTAGTVIGTDVQAYDGDLSSIAALTTTAHGRGLLDDANAAASRTTIGLGEVIHSTAAFPGTSSSYAAGNLYTGALSANAVMTFTLTSGQRMALDLDVTGSYSISGFTAYRVGYSGAAVTEIAFITGRHRVEFYHNGTALTVADSKSDLIVNADVDASAAIDGSKLATGGVGATQIASTAVTAGAYTAANITVDADGRITSAANGTSTRTGVYRTVYIGAKDMIPRTTAGASAALALELTTNDIMQASLDFDTTTEEGAGFWFTPPSSWDAGTFTAKFHWTAASGTGNVKWDIAGRCYNEDDAMDQALGTEQTASADVLITAGDMHISGVTPVITVAGTRTANSPCYFQVTRDTGGDTLGVDAKLLGLTLQYLESSTEPVAQSGTSSAGGGAAASFNDDFTRGDSDSLGANWTESDPDVDIVSNALALSDSFDFTQQFAVYSATACTTANQFIKTTMTSGGANSWPSVYFRYTNSGTAYYEVNMDSTNNRVRWYHYTAVGGTKTEVTASAESWTFAAGTVGLTLTGTGTSTVLRFWASVTANAPDSGGTTWDTNAATLTITQDPASPVNTGSYLGLGGVNSTGGVTHDNFYGGDIP